ncbi:DUF4238 domain-containing protein [Methylobacterium segetis]|uniref:DUF4238 domain-containing protein n=1 Tax=Methylobacterium segetis TaxID=2488750 RepID=UPI0014048C36|nr:DUF4238 domain-containing protein [Methylobacterium segetis]
MIQNPPGRHHFVPVFYTKQWAFSDGRICEYSRPRPRHDVIKPRRTHPAGTGWVDRLYELRGLSGPDAQAVEQLFMKPVDDAAAVVMRAFCSGRRVAFSTREMRAWARFMMSLMHRHPDDLEAFKEHFARGWRIVTPEMERDYRRRRRAHWPRDLQTYMDSVPDDQVERIGMSILVEMMNSEPINDHIVGMRWGALLYPNFRREVLTSDRPLVMTDGLAYPESLILMPIGPRAVFYAVNTPAMVQRLSSQDHNTFIEKLNERVVGQASRYVYAGSDAHLAFVQRHMSRTRPRPLVDQIAAGRALRERMSRSR